MSNNYNWSVEIAQSIEVLSSFFSFSPIQQAEQMRTAEALQSFVDDQAAFFKTHSVTAPKSYIETMKRNVLRQQGFSI